MLAYDTKCNPGLPKAMAVGLRDGVAQPIGSSAPGSYLTFSSRLHTLSSGLVNAKLVPFADAGRDSGVFRVWLPAPGVSLANDSDLLIEGRESRSRQGNVPGSINDGDADSFVVTFDGQKQDMDWFAVTLDQAATISRVTFVAGHLFHDGGWFDGSAGKPRVQVQREPGGPWVTVAEFSDYPATTATESVSLGAANRRTFTVRLAKPEKVVAVRVIGKPACGDNPRQAFSSCAELEAFGN